MRLWGWGWRDRLRSIPGIPMRIRLVAPVLQGWLGEPFGLVDDEQVHDLRGLPVVVDVAGDGQRRLDGWLGT